MDTNHSILRSAQHFFLGTLFSRFTGLVRDMAMAFWFGSTPEIAVFMVAYRLANLFRRLFGEGNLQAGFVPHFETLRTTHEKTSFLFYRDTAFSLFVSLVFAIAFMEAVLWGGSLILKDQWGQIAGLSMWMAPGLLFICLSSLNSAFLRCQKKYLITAASPAFFNFVWIGAAFIAHYFPLSEAILILSCGVTAAFMMQWISTAAAAKKEWRSQLQTKEWFQPQLFSHDWKQLLKPMAVGIIGAGAMQFNSALDALFGLVADPSGPAYLWYAIRIQQLPLALFGIALAGALLPPLSRAMQEGAVSRYQDLLETGVRRAAILMVPCTFAIFVLGGVGLNLLFGRGGFVSADLEQTLFCLWAYGIGIVPSVFVMLFATGFYAQKSYKIPTVASFSAVLVNTVLNIFLVYGLRWGAVSIALATSLSALLNMAILYFFLLKRFTFSFWIFIFRLFSLSSLAAFVTVALGYLWLGDVTWEVCLGRPVFFPRSFLEQCLQFVGMGLLFLGSFALIAKVGGIAHEFSFLRKKAEEKLEA